MIIPPELEFPFGLTILVDGEPVAELWVEEPEDVLFQIDVAKGQEVKIVVYGDSGAIELGSYLA